MTDAQSAGRPKAFNPEGAGSIPALRARKEKVRNGK